MKTSKEQLKREYFEAWNGKTHHSESAGEIVLTLRRSWSLAQMGKAVEEWIERVSHEIVYDTWRAKLIEYAKTLNFDEQDVAYSGFFSKQSIEKSQSIEESMIELKKQLFERPSRFQFEIVERLLPDSGDRHIRLVGDGTIFVGTSGSGAIGNWQAIDLKGEVTSKSHEEALSAKLYSNYCLIELSKEFGVEVSATADGTRLAYIYFGRSSHAQPEWYKVEVRQHDWDRCRKKCPTVSIGGYGGFEPELASRAGRALELGAMVAQNFENFLDQPWIWLYNYQAERGELV